MDLFAVSIGLAVLAAISWGFNSHIIKQGMVNANAYFALLARSSVTFPILLFASLFIYGRGPLELYFSSKTLPLVMASAGLIVLGDGLFMVSLKSYPVKLIVPITSVYPLVTTFILIFARIESISTHIVLGTALTVSGIFLVTRGGANEKFSFKPVILGLSTSTFWGTSIVIVRIILQQNGSEAIGLTGVRTLFMGLFSLCILLAVPQFRKEISNSDRKDLKRTFKLLALSGIVGWIIGASAFFFAVQKIGAAIATPISSTNPIVASIIGVVSKTESISLVQFLGIIVTVIGTIVIVF